jgi:hypothetical protein
MSDWITDAKRDLKVKVMTNKHGAYHLSNVNKTGLLDRAVVSNNAETAKVVGYRPMPSSSNNFVGRADYLVKLEAMFVGRPSQADSHPVSVLCGRGGMGKTQISAKFAETRSHL